MSGSQVQGAALVALSALLVPAVIFFYREYLLSAPTIPFSDQNPGSLVVEIDGDFQKGIYFVPPGSSLQDLLSILHIALESVSLDPSNPNLSLPLKDGIKVSILRSKNNRLMIHINRMAVATRLALGRPIDVNTAAIQDLVLVPGIGEKTAVKVIEARSKRERFQCLEELMQIKGIKQKRLEKLRPYLYVEKDGVSYTPPLRY